MSMGADVQGMYERYIRNFSQDHPEYDEDEDEDCRDNPMSFEEFEDRYYDERADRSEEGYY